MTKILTEFCRYYKCLQRHNFTVRYREVSGGNNNYTCIFPLRCTMDNFLI